MKAQSSFEIKDVGLFMSISVPEEMRGATRARSYASWPRCGNLRPSPHDATYWPASFKSALTAAPAMWPCRARRQQLRSVQRRELR